MKSEASISKPTMHIAYRPISQQIISSYFREIDVFS